MDTNEVLGILKAGMPAQENNLKGQLYLSNSGWLMLRVPNSLGRGIFDALNEPGIELPVADTTGKYNAHISVMRPEEIAQIGGADKITERGHEFPYKLGQLRNFNPHGWPEVNRCWVVEVASPELQKLRKSYGLDGLPNEGKYKFHITVAVRRSGVLGSNPVSKVQDEEKRVRMTDKPGIHLIKASEGSNGHDGMGVEGGISAISGTVSKKGQAVPHSSPGEPGTSKSGALRHGDPQDGANPVAGTLRGVGDASPKEAGDDQIRLRSGEGDAPDGADPGDDLGAYKVASLGMQIARAARRAVEPGSDAQAEAGNYRKGHVNMHGLNITIENAKDSTRSGTGADGKKWSCKMKNHYGYIRRTTDLDGDHVDVFLGTTPEAELVYVIDQIDPKSKRFDEHKCMLGFLTLKDAKEAYLSNYEKDWKGLGKITPVTMQQFKAWLKDGSQKRPISTQVFDMKKASDDEEDKEDRPGIMIIQKSTTIQMVPPDDEDEKSEFAEMMEEHMEEILERFGKKADK